MTGHPQGPSGLAFNQIAAIAAMIHEAVVAELDPVAKHLALHGHNGMQHVQDGPEPWAITGKSLKRLSLNCLVFFMRTLQFPAIPREIESLLAQSCAKRHFELAELGNYVELQSLLLDWQQLNVEQDRLQETPPAGKPTALETVALVVRPEQPSALSHASWQPAWPHQGNILASTRLIT